MRRELFDQACADGSLASDPMLDITSTASTKSGEPSSGRSRSVPTSPSVDPSTEARTSVLREGRPWNTRASSSSAAVSEALTGASGIAPASRAATITIWRREAPARRAITFSSRFPACVKRWRSIWSG